MVHMPVPCSVRVHATCYTLPHFNYWYPHWQSGNTPPTLLSQGKPFLSSQSSLFKQLSPTGSFELTIDTCHPTSVETPSGDDHCLPTLGLNLDSMSQSSLKLTPWCLPLWLLWVESFLSSNTDPSNHKVTHMRHWPWNPTPSVWCCTLAPSLCLMFTYSTAAHCLLLRKTDAPARYGSQANHPPTTSLVNS